MEHMQVMHAGLPGRMLQQLPEFHQATTRSPAGAEVQARASRGGAAISSGSPHKRAAQTWSDGAAQLKPRRDFSMPPPPLLPSIAVPPPNCSPFDVMSLPFDSIMGLVNARGHVGAGSTARHQQQFMVKGMRARARSLPGSGLSPGKGKPPQKPLLTRVIHPGANKASQRTPRAIEIRSMPPGLHLGSGERTSPILAVPIQPAGSDSRQQSCLQASGSREASQTSGGVQGMQRPSSAQDLMRPATSQHDLNSPLQHSRGSVQQPRPSPSVVPARSAEPESLLDAMIADMGDMPMNDAFRPGMMSIAPHAWPVANSGGAAGTGYQALPMARVPTIPSMPVITSLDESDAVFDSVDQLGRMGGFEGLDAFAADIGLGQHSALPSAPSPAPQMLQSTRPMTADLTMGNGSAREDAFGWADVSIEELLGSWPGVGQAGLPGLSPVVRSFTTLDPAGNSPHLQPRTSQPSQAEDAAAQQAYGAAGMRGLQLPSPQPGAAQPQRHQLGGVGSSTALRTSPSIHMQPARKEQHTVLQHAHTVPTDFNAMRAPDHQGAPNLGQGQAFAGTKAWGPGWGNHPLGSSDASSFAAGMAGEIRPSAPAAPNGASAMNGHSMQDTARMGGAAQEHYYPANHLTGSSSILDKFQPPSTIFNASHLAHGAAQAASQLPAGMLPQRPMYSSGAHGGSMPAPPSNFTFHTANPGGTAYGLN